MKIYKYYTHHSSFVILLVLTMLTACSGDNLEAPIVSTDLLVVGKSIEVSGGASQDTVRVEANGEWSVTTQTSWIHIVSPRAGRGTGSQDLIFEVDASTQIASRQGTLAISTTDGIQRSISVTQRTGAVILDPQPRTTMVFTYSGGKQTLDVTSNTEWTATSNVAWLTINGEAQLTVEGNQQLNIQATNNSDSEKKTGTIVFKDKDNLVTPITINVEVGGRTPILFVTEPYDVAALGGSVSIGVRSNLNWTILLSREPKGESVWAYFDGEGQRQIFDGVANSEAQSVDIIVEPNVSETERMIHLTVKTNSDGGENLTEERSFKQAAGTRPEISNVAYSDTTHTSASITFRFSTSTFPVTECGVRYSTSESDVRDGAKMIGTSQNGVCAVNLTGLQPNTRYYFCAYAINAVGTNFSTPIRFYTRKVPGGNDNELPKVEE